MKLITNLTATTPFATATKASPSTTAKR